MSVPTDLQYTSEHEWVRVDGTTVTVGITAYAADQLGEVVFADLPAAGRTVAAGEVIGEVESTKSVGELYAPVSGAVVEANQAVIDSPELVNADPFGEGWLLRLEVAELPELLDAAAYSALIGE